MTVKIMDLAQERRDAILNSALKEFASRGYDNASTNIIAKEAGISKALMFHYVGSKQELFLFVYDYFMELLNKEYYEVIDYSESDVFDRLYKMYNMQIELLKRYPWIFECNRLSILTNTKEINEHIEEYNSKRQSSCYSPLFDRIDTSKFREDLDIEKCKQFILWSNIGFTEQIIEAIRNTEYTKLDYTHITKQLEEYFTEMKKVFYHFDEVQ